MKLYNAVPILGALADQIQLRLSRFTEEHIAAHEKVAVDRLAAISAALRVLTPLANKQRDEDEAKLDAGNPGAEVNDIDPPEADDL